MFQVKKSNPVLASVLLICFTFAVFPLYAVYANDSDTQLGIVNSLPNMRNTGIPVDTPQLTVITKNIHTTKAGQVFDAVELRGRLYVAHPNVVIKRSKLVGDVYYAVYCTSSGTSLTIEDCDITGGVKIGNGFTGRRNHVHAPAEGKKNDGWSVSASDVLLEDNLIDGLVGGNGAHLDGIQVLSGNNIVIRHNWIEASSPPIPGGGVTSCIIMGPDLGEIKNVIIERNMFIEKDGYYPLRLYSIKGNIEVTNNIWRKGFLGKMPYNVVNTVITKWEGNAYEVESIAAP